MNDQEPDFPLQGDMRVIPLTPVPKAFYESNGLIFELFEGGQPYRPTFIRWERLKTVTVTRANQGSFNVHVNQGRPDLTPRPA